MGRCVSLVEFDQRGVSGRLPPALPLQDFAVLFLADRGIEIELVGLGLGDGAGDSLFNVHQAMLQLGSQLQELPHSGEGLALEPFGLVRFHVAPLGRY